MAANKRVTSTGNPVLVLSFLVFTLLTGFILFNQKTSFSSSAASPKITCLNLSADKTSGVAPLQTILTLTGYASRGSGITQYKFVFGDGSADVISTSNTISHTYEIPGTYIVKGYLLDKQNNQFGGTEDCQKTITVREGTIVLDKTDVTVTLDAANAVYGLVYGPGFSITSEGATGWSIRYNEPTAGQGFYESSGGIVTGRTVPIRSYININKGNGTYTGSAVVRYAKNGIWYNGPTVTYSITLINSQY